MPKVESNKHWTLRLFTDDDIQFGVEQFPNSVFGIYVAEVGSVGGRRHYHVAVSFDTPVTNKELTTMLDKAFPALVGNANRSKKQWRTGDDLSNDEFIQYMFKTATPKTWGYRSDYLGDAHYRAQCLTKQEAISANKKKKSTEQLPETISVVLARVKAKRSTVHGDSASLLADVVKEYLDYHSQPKRRLKGTYMMKTDIENIMFHSGNEMYRREWACSIMRQISQNLENKFV